MKNNFKELLRQRLFRKVDHTFDQSFWAKFNKEFNTPRSWLIVWLQKNIWLISSTAAAVAVVFLIMLNRPYLFTPKKDIVTAHEILQSQELLDNLELLQDFEDDRGFRDDTWDVLLNSPGES